MGVLVSMGLAEMSGIGDMTVAVATVVPSSPLTSGFRGVLGNVFFNLTARVRVEIGTVRGNHRTI